MKAFAVRLSLGITVDVQTEVELEHAYVGADWMSPYIRRL